MKKGPFKMKGMDFGDSIAKQKTNKEWDHEDARGMEKTKKKWDHEDSRGIKNKDKNKNKKPNLPTWFIGRKI